MGATMGKSGGNLLDSLPSTQGTLHVVMLGLDSAGKTTALYRLKFDQYLNTVPTIGFNCEKVRGSVGKAKGAQFLVWDVGGQEKLRPLWRSYTRCTDGIVFVVDSVDIERMEEAKMELMRTAKCPDNQGVPVLILANKQDLPGAREPKELEKLLGLHELSPIYTVTTVPPSSCSSSSQHSSAQTQSVSVTATNISHTTNLSIPNPKSINPTNINNLSQTISQVQTQALKGWYIQPACAITGEGLQEGLEALYDMITKKRKLNKSYKKKR